jgi:hypothetical protein
VQEAAAEMNDSSLQEATTSPATRVILFGIYFYFQSQSGA